MPKATSNRSKCTSDAEQGASRSIDKRVSSRAKASSATSALLETRVRSSNPYDKRTEARPTKSTPKGKGSSRAKANTSSSTAVAAPSSSAPASRFPDNPEPKVIARKFIGEHIVMLHLELMHDMDQIRLQYRNGTPLPRPNTAEMGFELYDRLNLGPVDWNGYGTPLVYRAQIYKRGSYVLRYKGRDVWEFSTDDLAEFWKINEERNKIPYDQEKWDHIMKHIEYGFRNPVEAEVNVLVHAGPNLIGVEPLPNGPDPCAYLPEHLFARCNLETAHQLREYKRRTGRVYRV